MLTATERRPETAIRDAVVAAATDRYGRRLRAVVLTGSLARGEGTFRLDGVAAPAPRRCGALPRVPRRRPRARVSSETGALARAIEARSRTRSRARSR